MANFVNNADITKKINYVILEDDIAYDWDDYDVWGAVLYDINNGTIVTRKYGHGKDMSERAESLNLGEAINNGVVSIETLLRTMINALPINVSDVIYNYATNCSLERPLGIPVTVTRGRKFKGAGYLVYAERVPVRYGLGAYHNEYNHHPVILNPIDGSFNTINSFGYIEYPESVFANAKEVVFNAVEKTIAEVLHIAHAWAYNMSYSACDGNNYRALVDSLSRLAIPTEVPTIVTEAIVNENARIAAANEAKMNEKLPQIIEWVKANTDKTTEEEILELAKHIYRKYNK